MHRKIFLLLIFIFSFTISYSQQCIWAKGTTRVPSPSSVATDASGNMYVCGQLSDTVDFDPGPGIDTIQSSGSGKGFIAKYAADGSLLWVKAIGSTYNYGDQALCIAVDQSGNVYVTGIFYYQVDFDPGPGTAILTSGTGNNDVFFAKYTTNGDYVWARKIGGNTYDWGRAITVDGSGNVYISGSFGGTCDFDPGPGVANLTPNGYQSAYVAKYNSSGNYVWAFTFGGSQFTFGYSLKVDNAGNTYVTGTFMNTVDFDPGPGVASLTSFAQTDIFMAKYNAGGNYVWAKQIRGSTYLEIFKLTLDDSANVYLAGNFLGSTDFNPDPFTAASLTCAHPNGFFAKYDSSGSYLWVRQMVSGGTAYNSCRALEIDNYGNLYVTGNFSGTSSSGVAIDLDAGIGTDYVIPGIGNFSYICKYTKGGHYISGNYLVAGIYDMSVNINGSFYIAGQTAGNDMDFGPDTVWVDNGMVLARYQTCALDMTAINPSCNGSSNGSATAMLEGATGITNITWQGAAIPASTYYNIPAGTYVVTGTSTNGCNVTDSITLVNPPNLTSYTTTTYACHNMNGSATVVAGGGVPGYHYLWSTGDTTATITGLVSNLYSVIITDSAGCNKTDTADVQIINVDTTVAVNNGTLYSTMTPSNANTFYQWINCTTGQFITGATNYEYTPPQSGSYAVEITHFGCVDTSSCHTYILAGIEDAINKPQVKIYPNPVIDEFTIVFYIPSGTAYNYDVVDVQGKMIADHSGIHTLNGPLTIHETALKGKPNGVYFLQLVVNGNRNTYKLSKQ